MIIKGGHSLNSQSELCQDWVLLADGRHFTLQSPRFNTPHTHGTGCTFSACLTAELAKGEPLQSAVKNSERFYYRSDFSPIEYWARTGADKSLGLQSPLRIER